MLLTGKEFIILDRYFTFHDYPSSSKYFVDKGLRRERDDQYRYMIMKIISVELFARTLMIKMSTELSMVCFVSFIERV